MAVETEDPIAFYLALGLPVPKELLDSAAARTAEASTMENAVPEEISTEGDGKTTAADEEQMEMGSAEGDAEDNGAEVGNENEDFAAEADDTAEEDTAVELEGTAEEEVTPVEHYTESKVIGLLQYAASMETDSLQSLPGRLTREDLQLYMEGKVSVPDQLLFALEEAQMYRKSK